MADSEAQGHTHDGSDEVASVARRLARIEERIAAACRRAGRPRHEVNLVGASKKQPVDRLQAAWDAGLRVFGENRVQEAEAKKPRLPEAAEWHLLGPLQSNKARLAVELFDAVHALDRIKIARYLDRHLGERAEEAGTPVRRLPCFVQVLLGGEESKHGFPPGRLAEVLDELVGFDRLELVGLMSIPPPEDTAEASRRWFVRLRDLRDQVAREGRVPGFRGWLSMGMSVDFEVAIEEGATHVRVGTDLFGPRD